VQALLLEETAHAQLLAEGSSFHPVPYSPEDAARRHGDDRVHEPLRAWHQEILVPRFRSS
jgi:hypothetical protein